ncbi:MAG: radical SAM protein [archaeon]
MAEKAHNFKIGVIMNLTAVVEVTENCNLECTFCLRNSFKSEIMTLKTLEKIISHVLNFSTDRVDFIWHGGEPLIAGIDFFKRVKELQNKYNKNNLKIVNNVQTNAILLNEDFIKFFEKEGFIIGTSIQGTKRIHDSSRVDNLGNPTFERVIKNISKLKKKPSAIIVLTKQILGKEKPIYKEMKKYTSGFRISEYFPKNKLDLTSKDTKLMPTPREYAKSMMRFYNLWKKDKNPIEIRPITEFIRGMIKGQCGGCLYSQKACNFSVIGVDHKGDFYTCMRSFGNKRYFFGNVSDRPLSKRTKISKNNMSERLYPLKNKECKDCRFWNQCNGGCPQESLSLYGDIIHKAFYCNGRKILFEEIEKDLGGKDGISRILQTQKS